jgi:CubicO group peptidase (beta-lactamase class C family)
MINGRTPDFEPDAKADYNNSNYLLLGYIIEKICQQPYPAVVKQRVFSKAGLTTTYYVQDPVLSRHEAASYKYFDSKWTADKPVALENFSGCGAIIRNPISSTGCAPSVSICPLPFPL